MNSRSTSRLATSELVDLSLEAAANQDVYGSVTRIARKYGVHRRVVEAIRKETVEVLTRSFAEAHACTTVQVTVAHVARCVVALYMIGRCSIWSVVDLLPILFPGMKGGGFGTVQRLLVEAASRAKKFSKDVRLGGIRAAALDEMFSQGDPVLAGVDLDTNYLFLVERHDRRTTEDWKAALEAGKTQGLELETVVRDGGAAIAAGTTAVFPKAKQSDDNLHAQMVITKVLHTVENRAYGAMSRVDKLQRAIAKEQQCRKPLRLRLSEFKAELRKAGARCEALMTEHEELGRLWQRLRAALEVVDLAQGTLRTSGEMGVELEVVANELLACRRRASRKAGGYIKRRLIGLTNYADGVHAELEPLSVEFGEEPVVLAMIVLRLVTLLKAQNVGQARRERQRHLMAAYARLRATGQPDEVLAAVQSVLHRRYRSSSAIESVNAALRTHLTIRKRTTDRFLHLFQAYFNLRVRRWGRFKSTSAWGLLQGCPAGDWLTHLGLPPTNQE
jgi:hypothetical protein